MAIAIRFLFFIAAFLTVCVCCSASYAQENKPSSPATQDVDEVDVVRVDTTLVTLPIKVMDRRGRFIPDLSQSVFHVYEDGVEQEIAYFKSAETPFTVALMLDASDSAKFKLKEIQDAAIAFVGQLRSEDRLIVMAFDKRVMLMAEATNDRAVLEAAIRRVRTGGGTSLYTAVDRVTRQYLSRIPGRKAIVLFTDGVDTESRDATYQSTLASAEELDALVYTIQYNTYDDAAKGRPTSSGSEPLSGALVTAKGELLADAYKRAHLYLTLLADKTGGRFFYTDTLKALTGTFERIAKELRQQYSIGYYPKKQSGEARHRIKVSVDVPDAVVRTRKSYVRKP